MIQGPGLVDPSPPRDGSPPALASFRGPLFLSISLSPVLLLCLLFSRPLSLCPPLSLALYPSPSIPLSSVSLSLYLSLSLHVSPSLFFLPHFSLLVLTLSLSLSGVSLSIAILLSLSRSLLCAMCEVVGAGGLDFNEKRLGQI